MQKTKATKKTRKLPKPPKEIWLGCYGQDPDPAARAMAFRSKRAALKWTRANTIDPDDDFVIGPFIYAGDTLGTKVPKRAPK